MQMGPPETIFSPEPLRSSQAGNRITPPTIGGGGKTHHGEVYQVELRAEGREYQGSNFPTLEEEMVPYEDIRGELTNSSIRRQCDRRRGRAAETCPGDTLEFMGSGEEEMEV